MRSKITMLSVDLLYALAKAARQLVRKSALLGRSVNLDSAGMSTKKPTVASRLDELKIVEVVVAMVVDVVVAVVVEVVVVELVIVEVEVVEVVVVVEVEVAVDEVVVLEVVVVVDVVVLVVVEVVVVDVVVALAVVDVVVVAVVVVVVVVIVQSGTHHAATFLKRTSDISSPPERAISIAMSANLNLSWKEGLLVIAF